jgi:hypothetical protein
MANERLRGFLRHLHGVLGRDEGSLTDAQLLERFVTRRDEAAFEVIVWRHGGLVNGRFLASSAFSRFPIDLSVDPPSFDLLGLVTLPEQAHHDGGMGRLAIVEGNKKGKPAVIDADLSLREMAFKRGQCGGEIAQRFAHLNTKRAEPQRGNTTSFSEDADATFRRCDAPASR